MQPIGVRQPHRCGPTCGLGALGRMRRDDVLTSGWRGCRHIVGARIRNAIATGASCADDGFLRTPFALRRSRSRADPSLGFQPGEQRVGSRRSVDGRARHAAAPRRRRLRVRRAKIRRIASVPSRRCSTLPQRSTLRNTGPKRLSVASIQSFSARTGQAPRDATRRTVTVRSAPVGCGGRGRRRPPRSGPARRRGRRVRTAEPGGGQQQQSPIAQAGEVAGTGGRHAGETGCRRAEVRADVWRCGGPAAAASSPPGRMRARPAHAGDAGQRWRRHAGPVRPR